MADLNVNHDQVNKIINILESINNEIKEAATNIEQEIKDLNNVPGVGQTIEGIHVPSMTCEFDESTMNIDAIINDVTEATGAADSYSNSPGDFGGGHGGGFDGSKDNGKSNSNKDKSKDKDSNKGSFFDGVIDGIIEKTIEAPANYAKDKLIDPKDNSSNNEDMPFSNREESTKSKKSPSKKKPHKKEQSKGNSSSDKSGSASSKKQFHYSDDSKTKSNKTEEEKTKKKNESSKNDAIKGKEKTPKKDDNTTKKKDNNTSKKKDKPSNTKDDKNKKENTPNRNNKSTKKDEKKKKSNGGSMVNPSTPINPISNNKGVTVVKDNNINKTTATTNSGGNYSGQRGYATFTNNDIDIDNTKDIPQINNETPIETVIDGSKNTSEEITKGKSYAKIPTAKTPISSDNNSSVIPVIAGLGAAAAAGIGAKVYMDKRKNTEEEDEIDTEEWSGEDSLNLEYDDSSDTNTESYLDDDYEEDDN